MLRLHSFKYKTPTLGWVQSAYFLDRDDMLDVAAYAQHVGFTVKFTPRKGA